MKPFIKKPPILKRDDNYYANLVDENKDETLDLFSSWKLWLWVLGVFILVLVVGFVYVNLFVARLSFSPCETPECQEQRQVTSNDIFDFLGFGKEGSVEGIILDEFLS